MTTSQYEPAMVEHIKEEEGWKGEPYKDHLGNDIIGFGTLLPLTQAEGEMLLRHRLDHILIELRHALPWFDELPEGTRVVLGDMAYNMGVPRLLQFEKMITAIQNSLYQTAINELFDSRYAQQLKNRAQRNAAVLRTVDWLIKNGGIPKPKIGETA